MKHLLINIACMLLLMSCGNSNTSEGVAVAPALSVSEKTFKIADALPLQRDSATAFLAGLFVPSDSMKVSTDGDFTRFTSHEVSLVINNLDSVVNDVEIWPAPGATLHVPLKELEVRMDSAWKEWNMEPGIKEPSPGVMGWYTDQQHRKKKVEVMGPFILDLTHDSAIKEIRIISNEGQ